MTDRLGPKPYIEFSMFDSLKPSAIHWLWPRRIPVGCVTLIVGQPGLGKSLLATDLAARVSAGLPWPDADAFPADPPALCTAPPSSDPDACAHLDRARMQPAAEAPATQPDPSPTRQPGQTSPLAQTNPSPPPPAPGHLSFGIGHLSFPPLLPAPAEQPAPAPDCNAPATGNLKLETRNSPSAPRPCRFPDTGDLLDCPFHKPPVGQYPATPPRRRQPDHMGAIFVCPEDSPSEVLHPRLTAAGADLSNVSVASTVTRRPSWLKLSRHDEFIQRTSCATDEDDPPDPFVLPDHIEHLGQAARAFNCPGLVILDPLHAALSPAAAAMSTGIDAALKALTAFARTYNLAVIAVVHLSKDVSHRPLYGVRGSVSLIAAARAVYAVSADPDDPDRRIVSSLKSVYGARPASLTFRILPGPRLEWESPSKGPLPHASDLPADLTDLSAECHSALAEACDWLANYLAEGPAPAFDVVADARAAGFSFRTLRRAKRLLAVRSYKGKDEGEDDDQDGDGGGGGDGDGYAGVWLWAADPKSTLPK